MGIPVTDSISPTDPSDVYPTHESQYGKGGLHEVASIALRDAIPAGRRVEGMMVYVGDTGLYYTLQADLTSWLAFGGSGGGNINTVVAGGTIGGHRVVYLDAAEKAQYASNQTAVHATVALGLTLAAAVLDDPVDVQTFGMVTEPSWTWTLELPIYLGDNGLMTQTPPVSPALYQRIVGFPVTTTKMFVDFREPVFLA